MVPSWFHDGPPSDDYRAVHIHGPIGRTASAQAFEHGHVPLGDRLDLWFYSPDHPDGAPADIWAKIVRLPSTSRSRSPHIREVGTVPDVTPGHGKSAPEALERLDELPDELNTRWNPPRLHMVPCDIFGDDELRPHALNDIGADVEGLIAALAGYHDRNEKEWVEAERDHRDRHAQWLNYAQGKAKVLHDKIVEFDLPVDHPLAKVLGDLNDELAVLSDPDRLNERAGEPRGNRWSRIEDNIARARESLLYRGTSPKLHHMAAWIAQHGSEQLRAALDADALELVQRQFYEEYLESELPGWTYVHQDDPLSEGEGFVDVRNPDGLQLQALRYTRRHLPVQGAKLLKSGRRVVIFGTLNQFPHRQVAWDHDDWDAEELASAEAAAQQAARPARIALAHAVAQHDAAAATVEALHDQLDRLHADLEHARMALADAERQRGAAEAALAAMEQKQG